MAGIWSRKGLFWDINKRGHEIEMEQFVLTAGKEALFLVLVLSGPPVLVSLLVGLTVSLIQATTQVQDQSLSSVPKIFAVLGTVALLAGWSLKQIVRFTQMLFSEFPEIFR